MHWSLAAMLEEATREANDKPAVWLVAWVVALVGAWAVAWALALAVVLAGAWAVALLGQGGGRWKSGGLIFQASSQH